MIVEFRIIEKVQIFYAGFKLFFSGSPKIFLSVW